ncbi:MAG: TrbI/VirB10 family protein [Chlorobium sp.]|nr:MAG: TrbI/VirB10 family protein [Chlorobium sp.]
MEDVHASKIPADDPRLRLPVAKSRTLKKGPVIAIGATVLSIILIAVSFALWPKDKRKGARKEDPSINQILTIPEKIRKGPGNDAPVIVAAPQQPMRSDSIPGHGHSLPGDFSKTMVNRGQGIYGHGTGGNAGGTVAVNQNHQTDPEEVEKQAAIKASPFFTGGGNTQQPGMVGNLAASISSAVGQNNASNYGKGGQNMQDRKNDFFSNGAGEEKEYVSKTVHSPLSNYEIKAGSIIPVILITAINSDLPGNVVAMVSENVYDTRTGDFLLIPKGTRVLGRYDSMVSYGQSRVQVNWNRLVRPDGSSILLDNMPGVDLAGNSGYKDKVDNHFDRLAGGVILSSLLSVGADVSQGAYTDASSMTIQQRMAANVGEEISSAGAQITRKNLDIQPTLKILAGKKVNVLVNKDMILSPYNENG